jgi:hypothetical protein
LTRRFVEPAGLSVGELAGVRVVVQAQWHAGLDDAGVRVEQACFDMARQELEQRRSEELVAAEPVGGQRRLVRVPVREVDDPSTRVPDGLEEDPRVELGVDHATQQLPGLTGHPAGLFSFGDVHDQGEQRK